MKPECLDKKFVTLHRIGEPSKFGKIYQSVDARYVIKKIPLKTTNDYKNFYDEVDIQNKVFETLKITPHIVDIKEYKNNGYILMQKCYGYTIKQHIIKILESPIADDIKYKEIYNICNDVIKLLSKLIDIKVYHGDCHVDNILYNPLEKNIKIIDFGLSYILDEDEDTFLDDVTIFIDSLLSRVSKTDDIIVKVYDTLYYKYWFDRS
jgi:tRNA A-37 threonylcarbamoyl transferase component Bud32